MLQLEGELQNAYDEIASHVLVVDIVKDQTIDDKPITSVED